MVIVAALLLSVVAYAQKQNVSGTVTDENGEPAPGVSVVEKGTTNGTATDAQGKFSLSADPNGTLVFSFIGYKTQEIAVGARTVIDISLAQDVTALEEVVVTGYTQQRKRDITGAVTAVNAEQLNAIRAPSIGEKLAGRATGVTISNSGEPGGPTNIRIRGISSFTNSDPLVIIDGVQVQGDKALSGLNPNDIESMQILKDASASSIYGARANAGVVVITTKQGKTGAIKVTYDGYYGIQSTVGKYSDFLIQDPKQYAQLQIAKNPAMKYYYNAQDGSIDIPDYFYPVGSVEVVEDGVKNKYIAPASVDESTYAYPDGIIMKSNKSGTDWWDAVFSPSPITEHYIGISGGSENATFSSSLGYMSQDGTMDYTYFKRFSARLNGRFNYNKFTFGENISIARSESVVQQGGNQNEQNTMTQILLMNTIVPIYDITGVNFGGGKATGFSNGKNPVAFAYNNRDDIDVDYRVLGNLYGEYKIFDFLKFRTSYSVDFRNNFQPRANFPRFEDREVNSSNNYAEQHQNFFNWTWTNTLELNKTLADVHNIKVLGGIEAVRNQFRQINAQVDNLAFMDVPVRYLNLTYSTFNTLNSRERITALSSIFGKIDYDYNDKYLLSFTVRRDGSSDFIPSERFGVFPAASIGWRISSESFMQGVSVIEDLKLRAGWGITGNQNIPVPYNTYNQIGGRSTFDAAYDITGSNTSARSGYAQYRYGNPLTKWEQNESVNVGFDAALLGGKVGVVFDVYSRNITGLIYNPPFPGSAGNSTPSYRNVASMKNNGWDLGLTYRGNINDDIGFNASLNFTHYKNEITKLDGEATAVFPQGIDKRFGEVNVWKVGFPISSFYGFINDGIFQTQAEVDALGQPGAGIGRYRRKDLNGDGVINGDDQTVIGNPHPDLTIGASLGANYKNFDLTVLLFASLGNEIYNYNKVFTHFGQFASNMSKDVLTDSWTETNTGASLPKLDPGDTFSALSSTFYVENGSYLRAQNIAIGYTVPKTVLGMKSLRVYFQTQNLFTITKYSGIDPAISNANIGVAIDRQLSNGGFQNDGWYGFDLGNYPAPKTFMVGVNATF